MTVFNNWSCSKRHKEKKNFEDNHFHKILRFFDILPNFPFTTKEKKPDY